MKPKTDTKGSKGLEAELRRHSLLPPKRVGSAQQRRPFRDVRPKRGEGPLPAPRNGGVGFNAVGPERSPRHVATCSASSQRRMRQSGCERGFPLKLSPRLSVLIKQDQVQAGTPFAHRYTVKTCQKCSHRCRVWDRYFAMSKNRQIRRLAVPYEPVCAVDWSYPSGCTKNEWHVWIQACACHWYGDPFRQERCLIINAVKVTFAPP